MNKLLDRLEEIIIASLMAVATAVSSRQAVAAESAPNSNAFVSHLLTLEEWRGQPWWGRYLDNVCRLTSALM